MGRETDSLRDTPQASTRPSEPEAPSRPRTSTREFLRTRGGGSSKLVLAGENKVLAAPPLGSRGKGPTGRQAGPG